MRYPIVLLLIILPIVSYSQVPIYFHVNSHNEESSPDPNYLDSSIFANYREFARIIGDTIFAHGGKWNFQTDWKFTLGIIRFDRGTSSTQSKNLFKWLYENRGFEIDPHHHEGSLLSFFNYADVAKLIDSTGVPASKNVGGFNWLDTTWHVYERGLNGSTFSSYKWYPNVIWGGGTPNHVNDLNTFGAWKPKNSISIPNFYMNDTSKRVTLIGNGCSNLIADTTNVLNVYNNIVYAINYAQSHPGKFYTTNLMFNIRDLNSGLIFKMSQILTMLKQHFLSGKLVWKSLTQKYETYNSLYHGSQNTLLCSDVPTEVVQNGSTLPENIKLYQNYPNPFNPYTIINYNLSAGENVSLKIYNVLGNEITTLVNEKQTEGYHSVKFDAGNYQLSSGTYYYSLEAGSFKEVKKMVILK